MNHEIECTLICPKCSAVKVTIYRRPAGNEHVFEHFAEPSLASLTHCADCGNPLERK